MKGLAGYTRSKITNCANNFLCSGKTNALKRWANIGLRSLFLLHVKRFLYLKATEIRKKARFHALARRRKSVKRDLEFNPLLATKTQNCALFVKGSVALLVDAVNC